jgi:TetR/AcrR family acrAB operon transcriptional repressor
MPRRTKKEAAETRERILEAALNVFSKKGYSRTTFVNIANEIGLTKGAVYWHFKTKPDLLAAMISHGEERQCARIMNAEPASVEELRGMVLEIAREVVENEAIQKFEFFCGFQIEWSTELLAEVHEKLAGLRGDPMKDFEQTLRHLQKIGELRRDVDADVLAWSMASVWVGALHLALHEKRSFEQFCNLVEHNFDVIIGQYSTRLAAQ